MDEPTANQFIASLVKSVQALCNGYVDFSSSIEVVGHIHLNIDHKVKLDYVLTEEVSKSVGEEDATLFSSHSYHSKPPPELTPQEPAGVSESASGSNSSSTTTSSSSSTNRRRKSHHVPKVDELESFNFTTVPQVASQSHGQANSNSLASVEADERIDAAYSGSLGLSDESNSLQNTEKESRLTLAAGASSSQNRRRKSSASDFLTSAKHRRTSDVDSKPDESNLFEVIHIKEEPEDDALVYHSSSEVASEQDLMQSPDFSTAVMESVDPVGQKEVASFMTGGQGPQVHHQPYPIMLHAGLESAPSAISLPGPSTSLAAMPSTSAAPDAPQPVPRGRGRRAADPPQRLVGVHKPVYHTAKTGAKRRRPLRDCVACNATRHNRDGFKRKQSSYQCEQCCVSLCVPRCFKIYHSFVDYKRVLQQCDGGDVQPDNAGDD